MWISCEVKEPESPRQVKTVSTTRKRDRAGESPFNHHSGSKIKQHSTVDENTKIKGCYNNMATDCLVAQKEFGQGVRTEATGREFKTRQSLASLDLQVTAAGNKYK